MNKGTTAFQAKNLKEKAIDIYDASVHCSIETQRACITKLESLYKEHPIAQVADPYATALFNFSLYQSVDQVKSISEKLEGIFKDTPTTTVAEWLGRIKYNLSLLQSSKSKELKQYASEIESLYSQYHTPALAEPLVKIYHSISISRAKDHLEYENKIMEMVSDISDPDVNSAYANVLFNSKNTIANRENKIDTFLGGTQTLESFGYYLKSKYYPKHNSALETFRLYDFSPRPILFETMNKYLNKLKSYPNFIELKVELLALLYYTLEIQSYLIVPKPEKDICHYTKVENIKHLITEPDSEGYLRMYNASYMNDPEEGTVLFKFLSDGMSNTNNQTIKSHNVYLSCFTTEIDQLPMWSLYGDNGKGCCLVLSPNYFDYSLSEFIDDALLDISSDTDYNCLYRVCYLHNDTKKIEFEQFKQDPPNLANLLEEAISSLQIHFDKICELRDKKKNAVLDDAISFVLSQIAYLFKDQSYSHENELRLLQYSEEPSLDSDSYIVPQLYVKVSKPLKYKKLILGPKINEPNRVIPYIQYSNKIKKIEYSKIEYR